MFNDCGMRNPKSGSQKLVELARQRQPTRPHFIPKWAERTGYKDQAALVKALDADKSVVSRWYAGASPGRDWQLKLCKLFGYPNEPGIIFEDPDTIWFSRFFRGREDDEIVRMQKLLQDVFPHKNQ